jgi:hypothetical protein
MKGHIAKKNGEYFVEWFPNKTLQTESFPLHPEDAKLIDKTYPVLPKWSGEFKVEGGVATLLHVQRYPIPEYDPYTGETNPYFDGPRNLIPKKDLD